MLVKAVSSIPRVETKLFAVEVKEKTEESAQSSQSSPPLGSEIESRSKARDQRRNNGNGKGESSYANFRRGRFRILFFDATKGARGRKEGDGGAYSVLKDVRQVQLSRQRPSENGAARGRRIRENSFVFQADGEVEEFLKGDYRFEEYINVAKELFQ